LKGKVVLNGISKSLSANVRKVLIGFIETPFIVDETFVSFIGE